MISLQSGAEMPALHSQLTLLQQASRRQSLDQQQFQEARAAGSGGASPAGSDVNSVPAAPAAFLPPADSGGASYSRAGETQARPNGRSDLSQALLFNTAGLESNLAGAQRGDGVDLSDVGDIDPIDADLGTSQVYSSPEPTKIITASGACHCTLMHHDLAYSAV